jgi:hypothetical protein
MNKIIIEESDSQEKIFTYQTNEIRIPLNSLISPNAEAKQALMNSDIKNKLVILIGSGNGVLPNLLFKEIESIAHILIIEPFQDILLNNFINYQHPKITFFHKEELTSSSLSYILNKFVGIKTEIIVHPNYDRLPEEYIKDIISLIKEASISAIIENNTSAQFALDWFIQPLLNMEVMLNNPSIEVLKGKFKNKKAILVSAGPSLNEGIDYIKKWKDYFYIFAVGPTLKVLLNHNIVPDFVISIDSSDINYEKHFMGIDFNGIMIFESIVNNRILKNHKGTFIHSTSQVERITDLFLKDKKTFMQAPSVAIYSYQVIDYLGFEEVYLIGQDLALDKGSYYADGIGFGNENQSSDDVVKSNNGGYVTTTKPLKIFKESFEICNKNLINSVKAYNLSLNGAEIKGIPFMKYNDVKVPTLKKESVGKIEFEPQDIKYKDISNKLINEVEDLLLYVKKVISKINHLDKNNDISSLGIFMVKLRGYEVLENVIAYYLDFEFKRIANVLAVNDDILGVKQIFIEFEKFINLLYKFLIDLTENKLWRILKNQVN